MSRDNPISIPELLLVSPPKGSGFWIPGTAQEGPGQGVFNWGSPPNPGDPSHFSLPFPTNQRVSCPSLCSVSPTSPPKCARAVPEQAGMGLGRRDGVEQDGMGYNRIQWDRMNGMRWDRTGWDMDGMRCDGTRCGMDGKSGHSMDGDGMGWDGTE